MRIGKISDNILNRSVLKRIKSTRKEIIKGAGPGEDCALFVPGLKEMKPDTWEEGREKTVVLCTETIPFYGEEMISYGVYRVAANLAASFAEPVALLVNLVLPAQAEETELRHCMDLLEQICEKLHMTIAGGHTQVSETVTEPVVSLTGVGQTAVSREKDRQFKELLKKHKDAPAGSVVGEVVMTGWIGLEGTAYMAKHGRESLRTRYPEKLIAAGAGFDRYLDVTAAARLAMQGPVWLMHDVSEGGVLGALWELSQKAGAGLDVDLRKIPIRQETVEICEHFGVNPYALLSGGCLMLVTTEGNALVEQLALEGIPAAVVGHLIKGNDKVIRNGEEIRFLDKPQIDEIYKMKTLGQGKEE